MADDRDAGLARTIVKKNLVRYNSDMEIRIHNLRDSSTEKSLKAIDSILKKFNQLDREADHRILFDDRPDLPPLLNATLSALLEKARRDGNKIGLSDDMWFSSTMILEKKNLSRMEKIAQEWVQEHFDRHPEMVNTFFYILGEFVDNVFDHSQSDVATINFRIESETLLMAIVDCGISIPSAYRSHGIHIRNDQVAMKKAMSGISTKTRKERGTGLRSVHNLVSKGLKGEMMLISGDARMNAEPSGLAFLKSPFYWQGTIANIHVPIPNQHFNFYQYVDIR